MAIDICTRTLLPASDTFLGIAAAGTAVTLIVRAVLGPRLQAAFALLYFSLVWAVTVAGSLAVLLPLATCQLAVTRDYMGYGLIQALITSYLGPAILIFIAAASLSSCLGAWDAVAEHKLGPRDPEGEDDLQQEEDEHEYWRRECRGRGSWLVAIVSLAIEAAGMCKDGMEPSTSSLSSPKTRRVWRWLFWFWPRLVHNRVKGFRRLGRRAVAYDLRHQKHGVKSRISGGGSEGTPLLPVASPEQTEDTDSFWDGVEIDTEMPYSRRSSD